MIGFPIINILEFIVGAAYGLKISYYFTIYNTRGLSYSLLMIIPFCALYLTLLARSISVSNDMSKSIYKLTKAENLKNKFSAKGYLKEYLIIGLLIIALSIINAGLTKLMIGVVTI